MPIALADPLTVTTRALVHTLGRLPGGLAQRARPSELHVRLDGDVVATVDLRREVLVASVPRDVVGHLVRTHPSPAGRSGVLTMPLTRATADEATDVVAHLLRVLHFAVRDGHVVGDSGPVGA